MSNQEDCIKNPILTTFKQRWYNFHTLKQTCFQVAFTLGESHFFHSQELANATGISLRQIVPVIKFNTLNIYRFFCSFIFSALCTPRQKQTSTTQPSMQHLMKESPSLQCSVSESVLLQKAFVISVLLQYYWIPNRYIDYVFKQIH